MKHLAIYIMLLFSSIACHAQHAGEANRVFQATVQCGGRDIPMTFSYHPKRKRYVIVGESKYGSPAIDVKSAGRLVVPDSVCDASGKYYRVNSLGRQAFAQCSRLTEVVLPDSLTEIGDQAFVSCSRLREVVLPKALRVIYPFAFRDCTNLHIIRLHADKRPAVYDNIFDQHTLNYATLIIPAGNSQTYINSLLWGLFHYIVEDYDQ